ncbi:MAG: helix-turn-helix transcriptional regulator [Clostridia bacterium]|nr:helix-turn-helix transcriptional regulator [Clostridia bacterium]
MELHEKLQQLRKQRGLTQEELAEALYVSRTAVSKWESGRGYPSIDSLKELSKFFSVSIDDLLSGEKVIYLAEQENRSSLQRSRDICLGLLDLLSILLLILPLYPRQGSGMIESVSLLAYWETAPVFSAAYAILAILLSLTGAGRLLLKPMKKELGRLITGVSLSVSIAVVLLFALTRQAYAVTLVFLLLVAKGAVLLKHPAG